MSSSEIKMSQSALRLGSQFQLNSKSIVSKDYEQNIKNLCVKKCLLETASNNSTNSSTSSISNISIAKHDFTSKEKNYLTTIEKLQKKVEILNNENKKLTENISNRSISLINKSLDDKEQIQDKDKIEMNYKLKFEKSNEENIALMSQINERNQILDKSKEENNIITAKLQEINKKYEDLEELYRQKLIQFKKEITNIKSNQNVEIQFLKEKIENLEKEKTNQLLPKDPILSIPLNLKKTSSFVKHNWDEFEEKITNLVLENEKLEATTNWKEKYIELESRILSSSSDISLNLSENRYNRIKKENEALKQDLNDLTNDNEIIKNKLSELEKKFLLATTESCNLTKSKEETLKKNFEETLKELEEQKEKNIQKVSKENHELKQHNDELKQQIENFQKNVTKPVINEKKIELKADKNMNSSPILIINEMLTPCARLNEKKNEEFKNVKKISIDQKKNIIYSSPSSPSQFETIKTNLGRNCVVNNQENIKYVPKNYGINKETCVKEISLKENSGVSFKDFGSETKNENLKNENNGKFDFGIKSTENKVSSNYLQGWKDPKKETKVISFNLTDNRNKIDLNNQKFHKN